MTLIKIISDIRHKWDGGKPTHETYVNETYINPDYIISVHPHNLPYQKNSFVEIESQSCCEIRMVQGVFIANVTPDKFSTYLSTNS